MKPNQTPQLFEAPDSTETLPYLLFLPAEPQSKPRKPWPLMLFLHGAGERGNDLWQVARHGPPRIVEQQPDFPFVVVSPQCPAGQYWSETLLLALLEDILARHNVDRKRVYLTGLSMGGYGTWTLGMKHPERFAAIVPICGGGDILPILLADSKRLRKIKSLGVWAFHGAKDTSVPLQESERMVQTLRKAGNDAKLTVYPEAGHDSWTETYANPALYKWLLRHRRRS